MRGADMTPRRRGLRTLKWAGVCLSLLISLAWAVSLFVTVKLHCYPWVVSVFRGVFSVVWGSSLTHGTWFAVHPVPGKRLVWAGWFPSVNKEGFWGSTVFWNHLRIPLILPFVIVAVPTACLWWLEYRRRIPPGHCQKCGYDLTGNVSGVCPECGIPIQRQTSTH